MTATYHGGHSSDDDTDIGTLWQEALIQYYEECGTDLRALPVSRLNMDHIMAEQEHQLSLFSKYRHDGGKLDKLRSFISTNSEIIITATTHIANAASSAFPPSAALLTAFNYVMNASRAVSDDYDMIVSFFDIMNSFLERVSMLERRMPAERPFHRFLINVFSSMLTLSAIARKCRLKGRLSRWAKALIDGSDPKLKGAFDALHMHLQRFESVAMLTTLKHTLESGKKLDSVGHDVKLIQAGVKQNLVLSQQSYALGLESKGLAKDAASTSHQILTVVTRQEERGAEYTAGINQVMRTLNKMAKEEGPQSQVVDAGTRKSIALRTLETLLHYNLDDQIVVADLEGHYVSGTCSWFRAQTVYSKFKAGNVRLLCLTGAAGLGKSTLAYTVVKALQEEFRGDTTTSVAYFFFREGEDRIFVSQMLRSCALQIAGQDTGYREEAVADIQVYQKLPKDWSANLHLTEDHLKMWELLFQERFTKSSGRRLVLVLDGVDEVEEKDRQDIEMILQVISRSEDTNIRVLFTSDASIFTPDPEATKVETFELTRERMLPDIRAVIIDRLKGLHRLRNLPQRVKNKIIIKVSKNADTMRYVDHMLRRINHLGLELSIIRQLNNLPLSTAELYRSILDECQKARTEDEIATLKKFFAWIAYSARPLFHSCARRLLHHMAPGSSIDIDEELEYRCSRILHLSNVDVNADEEDEEYQDDGKSDSDKSGAEESIDDDEKNEAGLALIGFQEKGLRGYFRPVGNPIGDRLRMSASSAHAMILRTMKSILCTKPGLRSNYHESILRSDAANDWYKSLRAINPAELPEEEAASVLESICSILSNEGGSIENIASRFHTWGAIEPPCVLGSTEELIQETLVCIQEWAAKADQISPSLISSSTVAWMHRFAKNPGGLFISLAEAHVTNWFARNRSMDNYDDHSHFMFAHYALYLGREQPTVQQNQELNSYFAGRHGRSGSSQRSFSEESFVVVSRAFPHIEMTGKSYLSIAKSMFHDHMLESGLEQLNLAIRHADTGLESMEIYTSMADTQIKCAEQNILPIADTEMGGMTVDDSVPEGRDEPGAVTCGDDDGNATAGETDEPSYRRNEQYWVRKALDAATKAAEIVSSLSDNVMEDPKVRDIVISAWGYKAQAELMMGDSTNTVDHCRRVTHACQKSELPWNFDILSSLAKTESWATFLEVMKILLSGSKTGAWWYLWKYTDEIHMVAKATSEVEYVLGLYREVVTPGYSLSELEIILLIKWASFYREVVGTVEATSEAKKLLNMAIDAKRSIPHLAEASFRLSDILLEEFCGSTEPTKKVAVYDEMKDLVRRVSESMGAEFDPSQSQTMIPLAHMARKLDAVEFQKGLDRTFEGCVAALTDEAGWNDRLSMTVLARVLALAGLEREAQIAATCQLYILNMEIHRRENGCSRTGSDHDNSEGGESDEGDDDEAGPNDVPAEESSGLTSPPEADEGENDSVTDDDGVDGDMGGITHGIYCRSCDGCIFVWGSDVVYLCYYCAECHLCQNCFHERTKRIAGEPNEDWQARCPEGHKHIRLPIQGWKGLTGGVFKIEDTEVSFREWLTELKEKRWPEVWERFWGDEN